MSCTREERGCGRKAWRSCIELQSLLVAMFAHLSLFWCTHSCSPGPVGSQIGATSVEMTELGAFMEQASQRQGYDRAYGLWRDYLATVPKPHRPRTLLDGLSDHDCEVRLSLFTHHLYRIHGKRGQGVGKVISALKMVMLERLRDTRCFDGPILKRAKQASGLSNEEKKLAAEKLLERRGMPMNMDMVWLIRGHYWQYSSWDCAGMDRRATWLGVGLGFDSGPRVCNLTLARKPRKGSKNARARPDHCIRAKHVCFTVTVSGVEVEAVGGEAFRALVGPLTDFPACVKSCTYQFLTGKTAFGADVHSLMRRSPQEVAMLEDLALWCVRSGVLSEDELLTRYPGCDERNGKCGRKVLTRSMYTAAIRWVAVHLGLRADIFFSKATRQGAATTAKARGQSAAQIRRGRWSPNFYVPDRVYIPDLREFDEEDEVVEEASQGSWALMAKAPVRPFSVNDVVRLAQVKGLV
jgi:hypothetical protein